MMKVIIVGGGRLGKFLADLLLQERHDVVIIEKNEARSEELASKSDALVLYGDATNKGILMDSGINDCDVIVAVTGNDTTNLKICELSKDVPKILSRVNDAENEHKFMEMGVHHPINTMNEIALMFKKLLEKPGKQMVNAVAGGKAGVFEVAVRDNAEIVNKKISELEKGFSISLIFRKNKVLLPKKDTRLKNRDILVISTPLDKIRLVDRIFQI